MPHFSLQITGAEVAHDNLALPQGDTQRFVLPAPGLRHRPTGPQQVTQQQFVGNAGKQLLQDYGGNGGINTGPSGNGEQMGESLHFISFSFSLILFIIKLISFWGGQTYFVGIIYVKNGIKVYLFIYIYIFNYLSILLLVVRDLVCWW